jgi:hypothetical protein
VSDKWINPVNRIKKKGRWLQKEKLGKPVWHSRRESLETLLEYIVVPRVLNILT